MTKVEFRISGNTIENVNSWPHLGHLVNAERDDDEDIQSRCRWLIGQINNVLFNF